MPLYMLGFMGATRRLDHYDAATGWHPLFITVGIGALIILCGVFVQFMGFIRAFASATEQGSHRRPVERQNAGVVDTLAASLL